MEVAKVRGRGSYVITFLAWILWELSHIYILYEYNDIYIEISYVVWNMVVQQLSISEEIIHRCSDKT